MDLIPKEDVRPNHQFKVGDFFLDINDRKFYVLSFKEGWLRLVSISGTDVSKVFADIESANYFLESFINTGKYKHYPQSDYEILITRKENNHAR